MRTSVRAPAWGRVTTLFALLTGVYGGYFGAGSGVMMVAVLGLGLDIDLRVVNALKTLAIFAGNVVASLIFVAVADLDWRAIGLLAAGSVVGGYVGARVGRRLPPTLFRVLVVVAGVVAARPPAPLTRAGVCRVAGSQGAVASRWRRASSR